MLGRRPLAFLLLAHATPTAAYVSRVVSHPQPLLSRRAPACTRNPAARACSPHMDSVAGGAAAAAAVDYAGDGMRDGVSGGSGGFLRGLRIAMRSRSSFASVVPAFLLNTQYIAATIGGTFAGGLHAVTGPDHLAALLPLCMGRRWWIALYTGAYWGLGHGIGAALVGALAFAVRGALNLDALSAYMEAAVGISIMIIGVNGIRESREWATEHEGPTEVAKQHSLEVAINQPPKALSVTATLGTGILHGCSGSGHLLGVMPALAMPSWSVATTYLISFGVGTMIAMSIFTAVVGELSSQMSERLNDPNTPGRLALASSIFALTMGTVWTCKALSSIALPAVLARLVRARA